MRGGDADDSLAISRTVSTVVEVVQAALAAHPAWVVAKGGITFTTSRSAASASAARRSSANCSPALCRSSAPSRRHSEAVGTPYVVFAGTSATTTPSPTSSTSSPDADNRNPAQSTPPAEGRQQI